MLFNHLLKYDAKPIQAHDFPRSVIPQTTWSEDRVFVWIGQILNKLHHSDGQTPSSVDQKRTWLHNLLSANFASSSVGGFGRLHACTWLVLTQQKDDTIIVPNTIFILGQKIPKPQRSQNPYKAVWATKFLPWPPSLNCRKEDWFLPCCLALVNIADLEVACNWLSQKRGLHKIKFSSGLKRLWRSCSGFIFLQWIHCSCVHWNIEIFMDGPHLFCVIL